MFTPFIYFWSEFLYQQLPDEDNWKVPTPPPLDFPDADDTNDSEYYNFYHSKEGRRFHEIGLTDEIPFDIVDGRKIYTKFSALNQPGKEY